MGGDRAAVQLYVRGTAAQEHTTGHRTVGRNVEIPGTDPGVGRWRVAAGSAQAVDAIAMGINAATGDRRVATPYVHTVAIPVVTKVLITVLLRSASESAPDSQIPELPSRTVKCAPSAVNLPQLLTLTP